MLEATSGQPLGIVFLTSRCREPTSIVYCRTSSQSCCRILASSVMPPGAGPPAAPSAVAASSPAAFFFVRFKRCRLSSVFFSVLSSSVVKDK